MTSIQPFPAIFEAHAESIAKQLTIQVFKALSELSYLNLGRSAPIQAGFNLFQYPELTFSEKKTKWPNDNSTVPTTRHLNTFPSGPTPSRATRS
jgi:hypothetical protein